MGKIVQLFQMLRILCFEKITKKALVFFLRFAEPSKSLEINKNGLALKKSKFYTLLRLFTLNLKKVNFLMQSYQGADNSPMNKSPKATKTKSF